MFKKPSSKIEEKISFLEMAQNGERIIQTLILIQLGITPKRLLELVKENSYLIAEFSKEVVRLSEKILTENSDNK